MPPTVREITAAFGYASTNTVRQALAVIVKAGLVERRGKLARGLVVTPEGRARAGEGNA